MRRIVPALVVGVAAVAAVLGWNAPRSSPPARAAEPVRGDALPLPAFHPQGVGSCASAACHGDNGPPATKGSEYTTWITVDPHARAYSVLFDERSQTIQQNLTGRRESAENNTLCLQCHALDPARLRPEERYQLADGVGCESCHGPAEKWRAVHYLPDWAARQDKAALGFRETKNIVVRAEACVTCHVGRPGAEVNHDLIAAGHPRLRFEYAAYLANYPKHWSEARDKAGRPEFEARAWAVGQLISAKKAVELLQARADNAASPWPEFAEYGCFSCHHSLQDRGWRQPPGKAKPGSLPWGTWYFAMLPTLADRQPAPDAKPLDDLARLMSQRVPDRKQVSVEAGRSAAALSAWLGQVERAPDGAPVLAGLLSALSREPAPGASNWDAATQRYLGIAAVYQALGDMHSQPPVKGAIKDLRDTLERAFPRGRESAYDSPRDYDPAAVDRNLKVLHENLQQLGIR
jgi:hypothetical protein